MRRMGLIVSGAALAALSAPVLASPQPVIGVTTSGQPTRYAIAGQPARITGFRSALWGMTPAEVRAAIARDFTAARVSAAVRDPATGNSAIIAPMASLVPGPGPAAISYVFGASTGRLIHVNLDWTVKSPTPAQRIAVRDAGAAAVARVLGQQYKIGSVMRGVVVQPDLVVLFAAADAQGGALDVHAGGIPYTLGTGPGARQVEPATGPATLHLGFSAPPAPSTADTLKPRAF